MLEVRLDFRDALLPEGLCMRDPEQVIQAWTLAEVPAALAALQAVWDADGHAAGFVAYEAAAAIDPSLPTRPQDPRLPLIWFLVGQPATPADESAESAVSPIAFSPALTEPAYHAQIGRIMQALVDGETYQLNYTFPLTGQLPNAADANSLYQRLRLAQSANFAARITGDDWQILSASPELFFRIEDGEIEARPMKGTRRRGVNNLEDATIAAALRADAKERAENVMIVDLLRNDLGRVCELGTVSASDLFELERYPTVWQMTSRVQGRLRAGCGLSELFGALFPCGSVTGAPKRRTMRWIADTEREPRGVYCGAIGALLPGRQAVFSVPIRTMTIFADGQAVYPVGSGIVIDADAGREYAECLAKARVIEEALAPPFELLETLRWDPGTGYVLLARHLDRITDSAGYFGWPVDRDALSATLADAADEWGRAMRVRLLLDRQGRAVVQAVPLNPLPDRPVRLALAEKPVPSDCLFLYHKTTRRGVYAPAVAQLSRLDVDDVILYNERGELTETTIGNLALLMDGEWRTPPISSGLLAGTMRAEEIAAGRLRECVLTRDDLALATAIRVMNSVRGPQDAIFAHF